MNKPIAVCISDLHFSEKTLELASQALRAALKKAEELSIPLVIAGDLHDTKAIIRGEVANRLIEILDQDEVEVYVLVGNHDRLNEKHPAHGLNYLTPYADVIDQPTYRSLNGSLVSLLPYQSKDEVESSIPQFISKPTNILIMHQGFLGAEMGEYIKDESSISPELVKEFIVISGHYHKHQTLGTVTYIGSPYTTSFAEANDPPKGFLILNDDGSYTREILNLRKHIILERQYDQLSPMPGLDPQDLLWLKVRGPETELRKINKEELGRQLLGHSNYKLELIYADSAPLDVKTDSMSGEQILDVLIDNTGENVDELKALWRELV